MMIRPAALLGLLASIAQAGPATVRDEPQDIILDNGVITLTISKSRGEVRSIQLMRDGKPLELSNRRDGMYMDFNGGPENLTAEQRARQPRAGYGRPMAGAKHRIDQRGPEMVEVLFTSEPSEWIPFAIETHWVLPAETSGFYAYTVYRHGQAMPAANIGQTRFVIKGVPGTATFTHWVVDDARKGPYKTGKVVEIVQDATEKFEDGTVFTKYDNSAFTCDYLAHGLAGNGVGVWMCYPSVESFNGGPLRQDLTVHGDNVLLAMFQSGHFGAPPIRVSADQPWTRFYGPVFVYINQGSAVDSMLADARQRARDEQRKWPYPWLKHEEYPLHRGGVRGQVKLADGSTVEGAWIVLGPHHEREDWSMSSSGYVFFTQADRDGRFAIEKIRPGRYTLWVSGANQFVDYRMDDLQIDAGQVTDLKTIDWKPVSHGRLLWQIGTADRGTREFRDGDNPRNYGTYLNYFNAFPRDVTFTVGKSNAKTDWNYAQWAWYSQRPQWTIRFDLNNSQRGKATLTLAMASVQSVGDLVVRCNDTEIGRLRFQGKTGSAAYRSGSQDSRYTLRTLEFDAALLKAGTNTITLEMSGAKPIPTDPAEQAKAKRPPGAIMYDAIRLEVDSQ